MTDKVAIMEAVKVFNTEACISYMYIVLPAWGMEPWAGGLYKTRIGRTGTHRLHRPVYEPCAGHIGRTDFHIQHAPAVSCVDYCCPFSPL